MPNVYVFEVSVNKHGTAELIKKIYFLGFSLPSVAHQAMHYVYSDASEFRNQQIEIGEVRRLTEINTIENPYFLNDMDEMMDDEEGDDEDDIFEGYNPNIPFKALAGVAKNDERIMAFKHSCGEEIKCLDFNWPYIICPSEKCKKKIMHTEIEKIGGIYLFTGLDDNK